MSIHYRRTKIFRLRFQAELYERAAQTTSADSYRAVAARRAARLRDIARQFEQA